MERAKVPFVCGGEEIGSIQNTKYLLNNNIVYDPDSDCQRISRGGYPETKITPTGASISIFSDTNKVWPSKYPSFSISQK